MPVTTFQGTVENGQVRLADDVRLPEQAKVYVVVPDFEPDAGGGKFDFIVAQVLLQMAGHLVRRGQRRQHVNEPEKLRLEVLIAHRPIHHRAVKAFLAEQGRRLGGVHLGEDLFAPITNRSFEVGFGHGFFSSPSHD